MFGPLAIGSRPIARRLVLAVGLAVAFVSWSAVPAAAHASLLASFPIAEQVVSSRPSEVRLTFTEAVDTRIGGVEVLGPDGRRVDIGRVNRADDGATLIVPIDAAAEGTHTVSWRVVSADGHTVSGAYVFHVIRRTGAAIVGEGTDGPTVVAEWLGRFLALGGLMLLLGSLWIGGPSGAMTRLHELQFRSAVALFVGSVLVLWTRGADAGGTALWGAAGSVGSLVADTWAGRVDLVRVGLAVTAMALARRQHRRWLIVVGLAILATFPLAGHAWSTDPRAVAVPADAVHLFAAAIWAGGVVALLITTRSVPVEITPALSLREQNDRGAGAAELVREASRRFVIAAPVVVATGVISTWLHISSVGDLVSTNWGRTVLAKVVLAGLALVLGAVHRKRLASWVADGVTRIVSLRLETAIFVVVLAATAALVSMVPAEVALDRPFSQRQSTPSGFVQLDVSPARSGSNDVHLAFLSPSSLDRRVDALRVEIQSGDLASRVIPVRLDAASHASGMAVSFGPAGTWRVTVRTVYRGDAETTVFEVELR